MILESVSWQRHIEILQQRNNVAILNKSSVMTDGKLIDSNASLDSYLYMSNLKEELSTLRAGINDVGSLYSAVSDFADYWHSLPSATQDEYQDHFSGLSDVL